MNRKVKTNPKTIAERNTTAICRGLLTTAESNVSAQEVGCWNIWLSKIKIQTLLVDNLDWQISVFQNIEIGQMLSFLLLEGVLEGQIY